MNFYRATHEDINKMHQFAVLSQFQAAADNIIDHYDYNDIKEAIEYAKSNSTNVKNGSFDESMKVVRDLFIKTITWLEENGRRV